MVMSFGIKEVEKAAALPWDNQMLNKYDEN